MAFIQFCIFFFGKYVTRHCDRSESARKRNQENWERKGPFQRKTLCQSCKTKEITHSNEHKKNPQKSTHLLDVEENHSISTTCINLKV